MGLVRSQLSMFFSSVHYMVSPRLIFYYLKPVLSLDPLKVSFIVAFFDKSVFLLEEKHSTFTNDECTSWYNRVGDF